MIMQRGNKWLLMDSTGNKILGEHDSKEQAEAQERAIESHKQKMMSDYEDSIVRNFKEPEFKADTFSLEGVEIFQTGRWNGDDYTQNDLDEIVTAFAESRSQFKPYVKLGHDPKQTLLQKDGYPSAGWITNLRRSGEKLLADIKGMPKRIKELIEKKSYGRISAELYIKPTIGKKTYNFALKAVALLGGDTPAVRTLDDFVALYTESRPEAEGVLAFATEANSEGTVFIEQSEEKDEMAEKEALEKVATLERQLSESKAKIVELEAMGQQSKRREEVTRLFAEAGDKVTPALKPAIEAMAFSDLIPADTKGVRTFSYQDGKEEKVLTFSSGLDLARKVIEALPASDLGGIKTNHAEKKTPPSAQGGADSEKEMSARVQAFMEKNPEMSLRDAVIAVSEGRS